MTRYKKNIFCLDCHLKILNAKNYKQKFCKKCRNIRVTLNQKNLNNKYKLFRNILNNELKFIKVITRNGKYKFEVKTKDKLYNVNLFKDKDYLIKYLNDTIKDLNSEILNIKNIEFEKSP